MNSTEIKKYIVGLLTKSITPDDIPRDKINDVHDLLKTIAGSMPSGGYTFKGEKMEKPPGIGYPPMMMTEVIKFDDKGQWSLTKPKALDAANQAAANTKARDERIAAFAAKNPKPKAKLG